jgi:hypothetical protein
MTEKNKKVRFIRVRGRIVPIKPGKYKPNKKPVRFGKAKAKKKRVSFTDTGGFKAFLGGGILATSGQAVDVFGRKAIDTALQKASRARKPIRRKFIIDSALKTQKLARFSRKIEFIGLGIQAIGLGSAVVQTIRNKGE